MDKLVIKEVEFNNSVLMAVQTEDKKIYVGVKWVCLGLGLTKGQMQAERIKIQEDLVLSQGERKINLPTNGGKQEVLCLELNFLPLWLAKINANIIDDPLVQDKLVNYQLHAADVLAKAFLQEEGSKSRYKEMDAKLRHRNTNIREANMYYKLADKFPYNSQYRRALYSKAVEVLAGEKIVSDTGLSLFDDSLN